MGIVFGILLFSLLIFVHELGHFVAAKLSGVQVNEFSMFMGPAIFKKKKGDTLYTIRCIPIGGYCAMEGEDSDSDNPRAFGKAAWWKRLIILVAGSFMNFVIGVVLVAIVLSCDKTYVSTELDSVEQWSTLGGQYGLQAGDRIIELDGKKISIYEDFALDTMLLPDGAYDIVVERDGKRIELEDVPMQRQLVKDKNGNESRLYGIAFKRQSTTAASVVQRIFPTTFNYVKSVIVSLKMLVTGQVGIQDMSGPVGIVQIMSDTVEYSETAALAILNMLSIGAFIAVNLAVMNLLPIPALDGGRVVGLLLITAIECVTRKKVNPKIEGYIHGVGMMLLLALMALIMFKDIFVIFKG